MRWVSLASHAAPPCTAITRAAGMPPPSSCPYEILGIAATASAQDVKAAYRVRAKATHPDLAGPAGSDVEFKRVAAAYELLKDHRSRAEHDRQAGSADAGAWAEAWVWKTARAREESAASRERRQQQSARDAADAEAWWAAEKAEAARMRVVFQQRAERARAAEATRKGAVLSRFWHTRTGLLYTDAAVLAVTGAALLYAVSVLKPVARRGSARASALATDSAVESASAPAEMVAR